jgi:hypothetical protein
MLPNTHYSRTTVQERTREVSKCTWETKVEFVQRESAWCLALYEDILRLVLTDCRPMDLNAVVREPPMCRRTRFSLPVYGTADCDMHAYALL